MARHENASMLSAIWFTMLVSCLANREHMAELLATDEEVNNSATGDQTSTGPVELCCCPTDNKLKMEIIPSICGYNLPGNSATHIVTGLSREKINTRKHLNISNDLEIPDQEWMKWDKDSQEGELVCHDDSQSPVRLSACRRLRTLKLPYMDDPDVLKKVLAKKEDFKQKVLKPYHCPWTRTNCELDTDDNLDELCYDVACNDIGEDCYSPTPAEKLAAIKKYKITYYYTKNKVRPFTFSYQYHPSICLTNEETKNQWSWNTAPKSSLPRVFLGWECPEKDGFERCRGKKNLCQDTVLKHKLPNGKCTPDSPKE